MTVLHPEVASGVIPPPAHHPAGEVDRGPLPVQPKPPEPTASEEAASG
jgi:hypothetical protein